MWALRVSMMRDKLLAHDPTGGDGDSALCIRGLEEGKGQGEHGEEMAVTHCSSQSKKTTQGGIALSSMFSCVS